VNNITEAEHVLQQAYDIDIGKIKGAVDPDEALSQIGVLALHVCYYDSGLAQQKEIREHLREFPEGVLACIIKHLRDARSGEYPAETLNLMYGLPPAQQEVA
jgi:hypothetical protein